MTYIILGLWLSVSLLIVIVANAVKEGETDDFINMVSFVWPIWLPILLAFQLQQLMLLKILKKKNAKLRAELSELKNYRGG